MSLSNITQLYAKETIRKVNYVFVLLFFVVGFFKGRDMKVIRLSLDLNTGRKIISRKEYPLHHEIILTSMQFILYSLIFLGEPPFAKTVYYTQATVLSSVSQKISCVESLLSVRFTTKPISKEDLDVCLTLFFHASLY